MEEHHHAKEREGAAARVRWEECCAEGGAERERLDKSVKIITLGIYISPIKGLIWVWPGLRHCYISGPFKGFASKDA
jgi:hypothetical protein